MENNIFFLYFSNNKVKYYIGAGYSDGSYKVLKNGMIKLKNGQLRKASLFIPHVEFNNENFDNDIALYKVMFLSLFEGFVWL